ncbi:hypothetical protein [Pseudomonas taiwanensis]|uniref:Uncharacterized protein n=1 Tax=Pseudomonas taiwanensis TaxID=470150 RepID=A0ABR6V5L0_9PSED|nr:hypothetical protein [Pseudomonas taiwanensis]MBC3475716.1 hypothetical protein [Pseudomonas taiwanensis]
MMHGDRSRKSMLKLHELLRNINESPQSYADDKRWLSVLATQHSLAEYSNPDLGVRGCAMGTFRNAASHLAIGFVGINKLRMSARARILELTAQKPKRASKSRRDYVSEIASLNAQLKVMSRDLLQMQVVIYKLRIMSEQLATDDGIKDRKRWLDREMREVEMIYEQGLSQSWANQSSAT